MPNAADGSYVPQADAIRQWATVAREQLIATASNYGGWITYESLATTVQAVAGITTSQPPHYWIGSMLGRVSEDAYAAGEPHLTSLCLHKDKSIGAAYPWASPRVSEMQLERIAAEDRLACYRRYASDLPADGGTASLMPEVESRLAKRAASHPEDVLEGPTFWWVNQGGISDQRSDLAVLWAPLKDARNRPQQHWDSLDIAREGDVVVHYAHGHVIASSLVAKASTRSARPPAFETDTRVGDIGRQVILDHFNQFDTPVALEEIPLALRESDLGEGNPFTRAGDVQGGYFFPMDHAVAVAIFAAAGLLSTASTPDTERYAGVREEMGREMYLDIDATDGLTTVKYRKEQTSLRARLFGGVTVAACGLCGRRYPVRYLQAAHIKSRSACSEEERKDWQNVVMAACVFGCDALFEDGMLHVNSDGLIELASGNDETPAFALFTKSLEGKQAAAFTAANSKYFQWRNQQRTAAVSS